MQPAHHGLWAAAGPFSDGRGAAPLRDVMQSQQALAAAGMSGTERQAAQVRQRLAPAPMVNT
jgi:hypothetical protein